MKIKEAFYTDINFGTAGLRGLLGAGTNRMNVHTVAKATQGIADYICGMTDGHDVSVAIGYDSRIKSEEFAEVTALVFAANGIRVHLYSEIAPTPCVSYAVRELGCVAGIMITKVEGFVLNETF